MRLFFSQVVVQALLDATAQPSDCQTSTAEAHRLDALRWLFAPDRAAERAFVFKHVSVSAHRVRRMVQQVDPEQYDYAIKRWPRPVG